MTQKQTEVLGKVLDHLLFAQGVLMQSGEDKEFSSIHWKLIKTTECVSNELKKGLEERGDNHAILSTYLD